MLWTFSVSVQCSYLALATSQTLAIFTVMSSLETFNKRMQEMNEKKKITFNIFVFFNSNTGT